MKLKPVEGVTTLNRLLLPKRLSSDAELREAAAKLHTDVILIYTVDTTFRDRDIIPPLTTISLGLAPNRRFHVNATAAGILMDTKTGLIYGAIEEGQTSSGIAAENHWNWPADDTDAADAACRPQSSAFSLQSPVSRVSVPPW